MIKYLYLLLCLIFLTCCSYRVHGQIISTYAGNGYIGFSGDGAAATDATLDSSTCITMDAAGNLFINDQGNIRVRVVDPSGIISTIAGQGIDSFAGDGGPATAAYFKINWGIALSTAGDLFVGDQNNKRVRKMSPAIGGTISTYAGNGSYGITGDGGPATDAKLRKPLGVAMDNAGNLFIGDQDNFSVRKVDAGGMISRYAGSGAYGYTGDGGSALLAKFSYIYGMATDASGNLYICDGNNNCVRKVNTTGTVTTIAGNGTGGFFGDNGPATAALLYHPTGVYVSKYGDIYIADSYNNRIRKINTAGIISTFAGAGTPGFSGDGGPAITAEFYNPVSITMDINDNLYVSDEMNVRIRKIIKSLAFTGGHFQNLTVCENTVSAPLNLLLSIKDYNIGLTDTCYLASGPLHGSAVIYYTTTATAGTFTPSGVSYTPAVGYSGGDTFRVAVKDGIATDTTSIYVTILPGILSAGTITGASSVCAGSVITLTDSATGGIWSSSNGSATVSPIPFGCMVSGVYTGRDTITYTVSNVCGTARTSKTITINTLPNAGIIIGPAAVCKGSSISLSDSAADGIWSVTNIHASVSGGLVTGLSAGKDTVKYTVANTFCKATAIHPVEVDTFPTAGVITGPSTVCVGSQITLFDSVANGVWSSTDTPISVAGGVVTGITSGSGSVSYSFTNACGTAVVTYTVTTGTMPDVPVITEHESVFYAPKGYPSYQWILNGIPIPGAVADSYAVTVTGVYGVIVTNLYGCSTNSLPQTYSGCTPDDLKVFPNPTSSKMTIQWCKKVNIRLSCTDGKFIERLRNVDEVDLTGLPNGTYWLSIYDKNGNYVKTKHLTKISR